MFTALHSRQRADGWHFIPEVHKINTLCTLCGNDVPCINDEMSLRVETKKWPTGIFWE